MSLSIRGIEFAVPHDIDVFIEELQQARREWSKQLRHEVISSQIAECLAKDMTLLEISNELGYSIPTIQAYRPKDVKRPYMVKNARYQALLPKLKQLRSDGMSIQNVCRKLHISRETFYMLMERSK